MNLYRFAFYFLYSLLWCSMCAVYAQNNQLREYTLEDGLPQSQVFDIIQDEIGYLWLGTQGGGLCRFNGEGFEIWNENDGLLSNYIHCLSYSRDSLFIGTKRGLSVKTKNGFNNIEGPRINKIYRIENKTYLATNIGVYLYLKNQSLKKTALHPRINTSIINDIAFDGKLFWIATNKGLWKLDKLNKNAVIQKYKIGNFTSISIYKDKIFAACFNKGVYVITPKKKRSRNRLIKKPLRINAISIHNDNELWVSTDDEGITVIDAEKYTKKKKLNRNNGLAVSHIRKSISDRQSNIWIATSGAGFYKYFQNSFTHYDQSSGLKGNRVYAIHNAEDGIWASNSEAGLIKIDSTGIHHIPQDERVADIKIKTITSDTSGNIWAGTDGRGILYRELKKRDSIVIDSTDLRNLKTDTIIKTNVKNHIIDSYKGLPSDWIRTVLVDNNTVWVASYSNGISSFTYNSKKEKIYSLKNFTKRNGIEDLLIQDMKQDAKGRIWYATQNGHLGYIKRNRVTHLGSVLNQKAAISTILFHKNKLYLGTSGRGIWWSDLDATIPFKKLKGQKKPYSDNIYQMIFDDQHNLWVGTERGVDKIMLNQSHEIKDVFHFGRNHGFLGIETCLNAITKDKEGSLWFGAIYGLSKYQPNENIKKTIKPKIHFEDVEVAYQSLDSLNLTEWTNTDLVLQLTPEQTELSFSYTTIDIDHPNEVAYRFKLNNSEWSPWSPEHKQNLPELRYGAHSFSAQSRNYRWEKSDPVTFKFFIDSPLYEKPWFQWTMLGLIVSILITGAVVYIRKVKEKNREERELLQIQNHLLSLEHKALRLQMNPHFIFNVLNGIKAMGTSNPAKMNNTINTFATLLREILYNSRKDHISLDQEIKTLRNYIEVEQLMASKPFTYDISVNSDLDPEEILIPPMLIQPFVENAIRHGILKGDKEGILKVHFRTSEEYLYCEVLDNGMGIFQSQKSKTKTDHQSMALTVTRERLESISGNDALNIKEILLDDNYVGGTQISFKIPLQTDY